MHVWLLFISALTQSDSTPKCDPNPNQLAPFDSAQVAKLAGHFHLTLVDTTGTRPRASGTDLVMWANDSAHRYQYMERRIGVVSGERPFGGGYRSPGTPWTDPEMPSAGILYHPGRLWLGTIGVYDGGGTNFTLDHLGPTGFSGRWTSDMGIVVLVDTMTGRQLPNPAGYYCAWRVAPFPDAPKPPSLRGA